MYAVITSGGKQYKVTQGETLKVEKLFAEVGDTVDFPVLMVAQADQVKVGAPYITGAKVNATVVEHGRADKVRILKVRRRKHHRKQMGHRQYFTAVKITDIQAA